jgi:hypothetical protein
VTEADKSVRQIWLLWGIAVVLGGLTLMGLVSSARRGDYAIVVVVPLVLLMVLGSTLWQRRMQARLLQQPSLEVVLQRYQKALGRMPHADVALAYTSALAAAYYGDYTRAEQFVGSVNWEGRGRVYEAWPLHIEALLLFWRDKAYRRGLAAARRAQELADVGGALPGAGTSRLAYATLVAVGEVLVGESTPETVGVLERGRKKLPLMGSLLATWGLAAHHAKAGASANADAALAEVRTAAPYCSPLLAVPS